MHRLYLQIYLTLVGVLLLFIMLIFAVEVPRHTRMHLDDMRAALSATVEEYLPAADRPREEAQGALDRLAKRFHVEFALRGSDGEIAAATSEEIGTIAKSFEFRGPRMHFRRQAFGLQLSGGRSLIIRDPEPWRRGRGRSSLFFALLLAITVGIGAYPLARRLTRRLERLDRQVEALGGGELSARVEVEGRDEVAKLASSFNRTAARIEKLVEAQRGLLASASHELRTPLTRMRVTIELLNDEWRPEVRDRIVRDIGELDELVGELLLASKLDSLDALEHHEHVDLLAMVAEEGARIGATTSGSRVDLTGDPRMLRRLVRNLFENAKRYGAGSPVEAQVAPIEIAAGRDGILLTIEDRGPGVPAEERERIFEPFYRPAGTRETTDGGVGLGLSLVRQIARHHGGDVICVERPGGGTRFEVRLADDP